MMLERASDQLERYDAVSLRWLAGLGGCFAIYKVPVYLLL